MDMTAAILQVWLGLLAAIALVAVAAKRISLPPPILLVIVGLALAFIPGLPRVRLNPQLVLLLFLPLLVYASAFAMSWREFRRNLRPISLLVIGGVAVTTAGIAVVAHYWMGLSWPVGFILGAIISPTDEVAAIAIASRLTVPRRIITILEGEGLVNDTVALILFRFALAAAIAGGGFSLPKALGEFVMIVLGETFYGVAVGWLMARLRRWANDTRVEVILSILTPFLAYWPVEHLGGSGVLATVATGLYVGWNAPHFIPYVTRLQGKVFWDIITYVLEGILFLLTGLQIRTVVVGLGDLSWDTLLLYAAITSGAAIALRFLWIFPATYIPHWIFPSWRKREPYPRWREPFLVSYAGMRGGNFFSRCTRRASCCWG